MHAAKGDLGKYIDKTKCCAWLGFCLRIKCKMENTVPTIKILLSTISKIKRHHVIHLHIKKPCYCYELLYLFMTNVGFFRTREVGVELHRCLRNHSRPCQSLFISLFSSPLRPTPTRTTEFLFRYSLILFIPISPQTTIVYFLKSALRF